MIYNRKLYTLCKKVLKLQNIESTLRQPTPVFLPGKSRGQRSLMGFGPWDCKKKKECKLHFYTVNKLSEKEIK